MPALEKDFFNSRQMLALAQILAAISNRSNSTSKGLALAAFQQYLRLNNMFCIWDIQRDGLAPFLSKNNYQPPNRPVENSVFAELDRGNWRSCTEALLAVARQACPHLLVGPDSYEKRNHPMDCATSLGDVH